MTDIKTVLSNIEKRFGKEAVAGEQSNVEFLSTGIMSLDKSLGGGWAKGRVNEIHGWESSGKSTIAIHTTVECQKQGKIVAYIDSEHAFDPKYAKDLGVDMSKKKGLWYLSQPSNGEECFEIAREFAKCDDVGLIVFDSNTSMIPKAQILGEAGESRMGLQARLFSQMIPTLIPVLKKSNCIALFIGQLREKIGIVYGNPTTVTCGNALKFYASQRVEISKDNSNNTKEGNQIIASGTKCKVVKNKVAPPFKTCAFIIEYGKGVDTFGDIINLAVEQDIINKKGSWFDYEGTRLGQGINNVKILLADNDELFQEIKSKIQ